MKLKKAIYHDKFFDIFYFKYLLPYLKREKLEAYAMNKKINKQ
jgi:hypothetical protein